MVISLNSVHLHLCWCLVEITKSIKTKNNDANGNIKHIKSTSELIVVGERAFTWDEQNRLLAVKDNHGASISHYVYNHTGERTFKSEGGISQANIGGQQIYEVEDIYNYTIYPSGNMVVSPYKGEYTKHYYSNGKKITSRIEKLDNNFEFTTTMSNLANGELFAPQTNSYTVFSAGNNQANCSQQLTTALNHYTGPQWSECRAFINSIIAAYPNDPCAAVEILNQYTCEENPPAPVADPTTPEYTPGQISEFDCLNELNILLNELSADTGYRKESCYTQVEQYVQTHLVLAPISNACEVLAYILTHFDCIKKEHDGHLDQPSPIEVVNDGYMHPTPENGLQEKEDFDERKRKPIW